MDECLKIDLEFEDDGLIDDTQFSENLVGFNTHELAVGLSTEKYVDSSIGGNENDNLPELQESMEPGKTPKKGRYNLRKSLAWDSAFFTSAGVLDAEELTSMITGADKCEKRLVGIQEEMTESTESLSPLGSDILTMGTLEDDLFVDIRASIQRSSKMVLDSRILINKIAALEIDSTDISSLEKEENATQNKNPKSGLKKPSILPTVGMSKCQPKQNIGKLGSGKAIKPDPDTSQTPAVKVGEKKSVLPKLSKTISRSISSSTTAGRLESVGTSRARSASGISTPATVSCKGTQPPKVSSLGGPRREALPKSAILSSNSVLVSSTTSSVHSTVSGKGTQPPKVSSLGCPRREALPKSALFSSNSVLASSTTSSVHSTRSSTSSDSSNNSSSRANPGKSNLMMPRRNTGKSGDVGTGPIPKTPSRATLKNKVPSSTPTLSAYMASNKISSSVSPASSISEWSSVSSSSSCRSMKGDISHFDPRTHPANQNADDGQRFQGVGLTSNNLRKSSTQSGGNLHAPSKPSRLRMPSHKFGFFDGGKSSICSPNRPQQSPSAIHNGIPKNGIPIQTSNSKLKNAKAPTARMATSLASIKPISPKPTLLGSLKTSSPKPTLPESLKTSSPKPTSSGSLKTSSPKPTSPGSLKTSSPKPTYLASFQEKPHTLADSCIASKDVIKSPILSVGVKGVSASEETRQEADKVETRDGVNKVAANTGGTITNESLGGLKTNNALGTEKENGYDKSTYHKVNGSIEELLGDTSACRAPLALKNSFTNDECCDMPKEFVTQVADKTGFLLPASEPEEY